MFAGQRICSVGEGNVAGSGTYVHDGFICASLAGYVNRTVTGENMVNILFVRFNNTVMLHSTHSNVEIA